MISEDKLITGSTDFRLIDHSVRREFLNLKETDRITRGLIDWLGFRRSYIPFEAVARQKGSPGYNRRSLMRLAAHSFVSLTPEPLYLFGYLGIFITTVALALGSSVFVEQILMGDPLHWKFTGTAMLSILILFLIGLVLLSQGILSLYVSHIHSQSKQRPLYVIDREGSVGIGKKTGA
jgi:dolichol-phosphate mannosyltransferase